VTFNGLEGYLECASRALPYPHIWPLDKVRASEMRMGAYPGYRGQARTQAGPLVAGATGQDEVLPVLLDVGDFTSDEATPMEKGQGRAGTSLLGGTGKLAAWPVAPGIGRLSPGSTFPLAIGISDLIMFSLALCPAVFVGVEQSMACALQKGKNNFLKSLSIFDTRQLFEVDSPPYKN
jgi:hypothetical protein